MRFGNAPDGLPVAVALNAPPRAEDLLQYAADALGMDEERRDFMATPLGYLVDGLRGIIHGRFLQTIEAPTGRPIKAILVPKPLKGIVGATLFQRLVQEAGPADTVATVPVADTRAITQALKTNDTQSAYEHQPDFNFQVGQAFPAFPEDASSPIVVHMVMIMPDGQFIPFAECLPRRPLWLSPGPVSGSGGSTHTRLTGRASPLRT